MYLPYISNNFYIHFQANFKFIIIVVANEIFKMFSLRYIIYNISFTEH